MGASSSKDVLLEAQQRTLDISHHLTPEKYMKHVNGECVEGSLLELPWEMYYNTVSLYEHVNASFNFIGSIPAELSLHVPHLRHLDLSHNQLTSLPPTFQLLLHLRTLYLSYNRFRQFPWAAVAQLPHLHTLDLSHNSLRELPQQGWHIMTALERLNVSHNQLQMLPNKLSRCPVLSVLVVKGNQLMHPPPHVCEDGSEAILSYLRAQTNKKDGPKLSPPLSPVFRRVRGDHVSASVSNPESAWRQYQQGSYTGPGSKRKCPMMPPKDATTLLPHSITQALMGLVYGAVVAESVGLSCEGLSRSEARFYYTAEDLAPDNRIRDHLRSHYPKDDWGPLADLMLTTLDSVLRWGGVVDELEWAAQVHQWTVHGLSDVDDRPGAPFSALLKEVLSSPSYAVNPYASAESVFRRLTLDPGADSLRNRQQLSDSFTIAGQSRSNDEDHPLLHPNDNSCLPSALIMGLPSFSQVDEVRSNAERICRASHAAPAPRAAAVFLAALVAAILQGRLECVKTSPYRLEPLLDDLLISALQSLPDSLEKAVLLKVWHEDVSPKDAGLPSCHVAYTLHYLKKALVQYCAQVWAKPAQSSATGISALHQQQAGTGVAGGRPAISSTSSEGAGDSSSVNNRNGGGALMHSQVTPGSVPASALYSQTVSDASKPGDGSGSSKQSLDRSRSLDDAYKVRIHLNDQPLGAENITSGAAAAAAASATTSSPQRHSIAGINQTSSGTSPGPCCSVPDAEKSLVFKRVLSAVCLEGGWGACAHACVVGGVLGALGGFNALPNDWTSKMGVSNKRYLNAKVNLLLDMFGLP